MTAVRMVATLGTAAVLVAACSSSSPKRSPTVSRVRSAGQQSTSVSRSPSTARPSASFTPGSDPGIARESAAQLMEQAEARAVEAGFRLTGSLTEGDATLGVDMSYSRGRSTSAGTISVNDGSAKATAQLRRVDLVTYLRADSSFYSLITGADGVAAARPLFGKWVKVGSKNTQLATLIAPAAAGYALGVVDEVGKPVTKRTDKVIGKVDCYALDSAISTKTLYIAKYDGRPIDVDLGSEGSFVLRYPDSVPVAPVPTDPLSMPSSLGG